MKSSWSSPRESRPPPQRHQELAEELDPDPDNNDQEEDDEEETSVAYQTYRLLCFDDPHRALLTPTGCLSLAQELLKEEEEPGKRPSSSNLTSRGEPVPLALSAYLVAGIHHLNTALVTSSSFLAASPSAPPSSAQKEEDPPNDHHHDDRPLSWLGPSSSSSSSPWPEGWTLAGGAAALHWTIHGLVPLACLTTTDTTTTTVTTTTTTSSSSASLRHRIRSWLGSYRPSGPPEDHALLSQEDLPNPPAPLDAADTNGPAIHPLGNENGQQQHGNGHALDQNHQEPDYQDQEDSSLAEVWAAESDPSDYDYQSQQQQQQHHEPGADGGWAQELEAWARAVEQERDPGRLSQPPAAPPQGEEEHWSELMPAVVQLIMGLEDRHLVPLLAMMRTKNTTRTTWATSTAASSSSVTAWASVTLAPSKITEALTQLVLLTLLSSQSGPGEDQHHPLFSSSVESNSPWPAVGSHVLHVFRNLTLHLVEGEMGNFSSSASSTTRNASTMALQILSDYLSLLKSLIQTHGVLMRIEPEQPAASQNANDHQRIAPATGVGLSALSSFCSTLLDRRSGVSSTAWSRVAGILQAAVIELADEFSLLLELKLDDPLLPWTFLSLWNTVVARPLTQAQSQVILNSGWLRQWLLCWSQLYAAQPSNLEDQFACFDAIQSTLLDLCIASPSLLGKYTWRFPHVAASVSRSSLVENGANGVEKALIMPRLLLDAFLWNLVGMHLSEIEPNSSLRVVWKSNNSTKLPTANSSLAPPNAVDCQARAWSMFQNMCQQLITILTDWRLRQEHSLAVEPAEHHLKNQLSLLEGFLTLEQRLLSSSFLKRLFVELPSVDSTSTVMSTDAIRRQLHPIQEVISQWPVDSKQNQPADESSGHGDDDDEKEKQTATKVAITLDDMIKKLRRSVKSIILLTEAASPDADECMVQTSKCD